MMAKQNGRTLTSTTSNFPVIELDDSGSTTDFELDLDESEDGKLSPVLRTQQENVRTRRSKEWESWKDLFQHLLHFSEDILPKVLYEPMKWCHVSIYKCLEHILKVEEIVRKANAIERRILERNLEEWNRYRQTKTSKSRLPISLDLYKHAGDVFYSAFYQNRAILPEVREHLEPAFEAVFGSQRLRQTRALFKIYASQLLQIENFLSQLPQLYRCEVLAGIICDYLNPHVKEKEQEGIIVKRVKELMTSPDRNENQMTLMMLSKEECEFKSVILDSMFKHIVLPKDSYNESGPKPSTSSNVQFSDMYNTTSEDRIRYRMKLFSEAETDLLVRACVATEHLPLSLFDIIARGLDLISRPVTQNRSKIFEDFRLDLFDDNDPAVSLPTPFLRFFKKIQEDSSTSQTLLEKVKSAFSKKGPTQSKDLNVEFWKELFKLLSN